MDKAVNYVLNWRDTAETYLEDGRCSFTNNLSENPIRAFAVVSTMVEIIKAHDLNIYGYLKFLLEHWQGKDVTDEQMADLAPWSEKFQIYQKSHVNYIELLQLSKGRDDFKFYRGIIWRLQKFHTSHDLFRVYSATLKPLQHNG